MKKVIKFDESKPMHKNALDLYEMLLGKTTPLNRFMSIPQAKYFLGSLKRTPQYLQTSTLHDLENLGFIRMGKFEIEVLTVV